MSQPLSERYTAVAIVLHWAIAAAIVGNLLLGWWMGDAIETAETQARAIAAIELHKSLGLTVLVLSLLRLAWRLIHRPPALPAAMPLWEQWSARAAHWAFYGLMVAIPFSGWLYVSTQWRGQAPLNVPTLWFGLFEVPHLFGLNQMARELRQAFAESALETHEFLAWSMALLLVLHVAAALKHYFLNRDAVLAHMLPVLRPPNQLAAAPRDWPRSVVLIGGTVGILLSAAAFAWAVFRTPGTPATWTEAGSSIGDLPATEGTEAATTVWSVSPASEIVYSGVHAGTPFQGRFTRWRADIRFDPADLARSSIVAIIETGSASDGIALHDETLPQAEWFDVARHPTATFRSTGIHARGADRYDLEGSLTIKGRELVLPPLALTLAGDQLTIGGSVTISRRDADLGMESDPDSEYVSPEIVVDVHVTAQRRP